MARGPKKSAQANSRSKAPSKAPVSKSASKPQPSKGGKAPSKHQQPESEDEESYDESDDENFIALQKKSKHHDSDDEDEQAAFDLNMGDSEDEDDDEEEDEDDSDDMSDEIEDDDEDDDRMDDDNDIEALVNKLPLEMRRKILSKEKVSESEESEADGSDEDEANRWGKKKNYWNADTADIEDADDLDDAKEEEAATKELLQAKLKRMQKQDFYDDLEGSDAEGDDSLDEDSQEANTLGAKLQSKNKASSKGKVKPSQKKADETDDVLLGGGASKPKDASKLSKQEKLELLKAHSPELPAIVEEVKERVSELQGRIQPLREYIRKITEEDAAVKSAVSDDLVEYLDVKQQMLCAYITNVTFYLYMKSLGKSVRNHPVMSQLLRLRYAMEKMATMDQKVKYQIDRLVKLAEMNTSAQDFQKSMMRPNLAAMGLDDDEEDNDASDSDDAKPARRATKKGSSKAKASQSDSEDDADDMDEDEEHEVYRAAKNMALHYPNGSEDPEHNPRDKKAAKKLAKQKDKLRHSELVAALRDEFSDAPEQAGSGGLDRDVGDAKRLEEEAQARQQFEEDHFVRLQLSRKEKQAMKRREREVNRLDNFDDIGDFADLEALGDLANSSEALRKTAATSSKTPAAASSSSSSQALERAFQALGAGKAVGTFGGRDSDDDGDDYGDDDDDMDLDNIVLPSSNKRRRPAPEQDEDLDGDDGAVFDDFLSKKAKFQEKKKAHYQPEARYGGFEETVDENDKRAASYEIIKNKGLTPHRKKINRNPRVKKREKYADAVVRRKGAVRDVITGAAASYDGEKTGIKANVARSRKM